MSCIEISGIECEGEGWRGLTDDWKFAGFVRIGI